MCHAAHKTARAVAPGFQAIFLMPTPPAEKTAARRDQAEHKKILAHGNLSLGIADKG
jgi:hypothetical protein